MLKSEKTMIARAVVKKLKAQVIDSNEARLMFAVFEQAVMDAISDVGDTSRGSAARYLRSDMIHLDLAGVDIDYAARVMKSSGFYDLMPAMQ